MCIPMRLTDAPSNPCDLGPAGARGASPRRASWLATLWLATASVAMSQVDFSFVRAGRESQRGTSTLVRDGNRWTAHAKFEGEVLDAELVRNETGTLLSYVRTARSADTGALIETVRLEPIPGRGYTLREEQPFGNRERRIAIAPVAIVLDGRLPEVFFSVETPAGRGFRALDLARGEAVDVSVLARDGGGRVFDLPGGAVALEADPDGRARRLTLPGGPLASIARADLADLSAAPAFPSASAPVSIGPDAAPISAFFTPVAPPREGSETRFPAAVLVPDADAESSAGLLAELARDLAAEGWACLRLTRRVDERGDAGGLPGLQADGLDAVRWLRERPDVDGRRIALVGHGDGALIAALLAGRKDTGVAAFAALSPMVRPLLPSLEARLVARLSQAGADRERQDAEIARLRADLDRVLGAERPDLAPAERVLYDVAWVDPIRALMAVPVPMLVLFGETDQRVPESHRALLRSSMALGKQTTYRFHVLSGADHEFVTKAAPEGSERDSVRHPALLPFVRDFLREAPASTR